ncbi:fatty acid desaturase CarF family protein [Sphingobium aquiterrae]|uniref:fatty acid desaturase CarF family protein n=1 Tax=Sphingobium aquiterrae TaxID=2038656 RepID=UPI0030173C53
MLMRVVLVLFFLSLAANIGFALADPHWLAIPALLLGWYVADMLSGLVHMYMDYRPCAVGVGLDRIYFYEGSRESEEYQAMFRAAMTRINPLERLIYDFKNHHPRPNALGRRGVTRLIGSTVVVGALPLSMALNIVCLLLPSWGLTIPGWVVAGFSALLLGGAFAQYFHGTLHREHNVWIVRAMRRVGLLMTPRAHQLHHDTLKRDFSTNCGWSNPLLNALFALAYRRRWLRDEGLEPVG